MRITWRRLFTPFLIFTLSAAVWVKHSTLLRDTATWWVVSDSLNEPADAIVVLGGGLNTRPDAAAGLYKLGLGKRILIVDTDESDRTFAKLNKLGITPDSLIKLKSPVWNTYQEARSTLDWAKANGAMSIIVPTELFHTRRVRWVFRKELGSAGIDVKIYAIDELAYSSTNWWHYEDGWITFSKELAKYLFYRARY